MADKPTYEELEQRIRELEGQRSGHLELDLAALFQCFEDSFPVGITDQKGVVLYVNNALVETWGYSDPEDIIGRQLAEFWEGPGIYGTMEDLATKGWSMGKDIGKRKDDSLFPVGYKAIMCKDVDGKPLYMLGQFFDISEQKRAEEALRESEAMHWRLLDKLDDIIWTLGLDLRTTYVSPSIEKKLGFTPEERVAQDPGEQMTPTSYACMTELLKNELYREQEGGLDPERSLRIEVEYYHKNGATLWFENIVSGIRDENGVLFGIHGVSRDITDRKQADDALRESEDKYRNLVEESFDGIFIQKGPNIIFVNRRLNEMLGYEEGELIGQNHWVVYHPDYQKLTRERAQARMLGEEVLRRYEVKLQRKDGSWFYGEINARPITFPSDEERGIQVWIKDIMEQKLAEETLRESEERYRGLIGNITDLVYSHDLEGRFITVNQAAVKAFGYSPEELIGHPISDFLLPEYRQAFKEDYLAHIIEKGSSDGVTMYVAKDGSKRYIEYRNVLVKQEGMEPFLTGSGRDISEKILSERKVLKLQEQLHRSQKMEAMGLMAGGIAHDLNNILSGIVSYPELLLMDLPKDSPLRKPIKTIQESGMRAVDVVADLLTIARGVATGKEVLNLNTTVKEYLDSAEHQKLEIAYPFVTFRPLLDAELLNIYCSPIHIKKTLMNLVMNASEAIEGRGTVTISTTSRYLDEALKGYENVSTGEYAVLGVSDDGSGIAPEDLARIFEPFYTKKVMGRSGTGLGLAVVWNTVQDHKGYIDVKSSEKGTLFELYLPVTRKEIAAAKEEVPLEDYLGHGEMILVVDDEERQREIACGMLTKLGYTAEAVSSGEEAIEYIKQSPVDLIVLDMFMPKGLNGRETYEEIIKFHPKQKAIIASGYAKTKEVNIAQKLGAGKYIKKPYTLGKVGLAVREELEK